MEIYKVFLYLFIVILAIVSVANARDYFGYRRYGHGYSVDNERYGGYGGYGRVTRQPYGYGGHRRETVWNPYGSGHASGYGAGNGGQRNYYRSGYRPSYRGNYGNGNNRAGYGHGSGQRYSGYRRY